MGSFFALRLRTVVSLRSLIEIESRGYFLYYPDLPITIGKIDFMNMTKLKPLSFAFKALPLKTLSCLFLFAASGCSRNEEPSATDRSDPVAGENTGSSLLPTVVDETSSSGKKSLAKTKLEGPDGDMDGDGIPNSKDPDPLVPEDNASAPNPSRTKNTLEGPDGDMDGDGIPNSKDPKPLEK